MRRKLLISSLATLLALTGLAVPDSRPAEAGYWTYPCRMTRGVDRATYTFAPGAKSGKVPGHAIVGFRNPLPGGYSIEGGGYQYWKDENGMSLFLVNGWPWGYRLTWTAKCVGGWRA